MTKLVKLSERVNYLSKKLAKLERKEKIMQIKENKAKRKKRAVHLFILGNIFKYAEIDNIEEETLIGYCLSFSKINPLKLEQYMTIGKQVLIEKEAERQEKAKKLKNNIVEKSKEKMNFSKKEYSRMIRLGAVFEMAKIDTVELAVLIGFILDFKNKSAVEENNFYVDGKIFKFERDKKRKLKKEN